MIPPKRVDEALRGVYKEIVTKSADQGGSSLSLVTPIRTGCDRLLDPLE